MDHWDTQAAWQYHDGTKHPSGFLLDPNHSYDPHRRPLLFKNYLDLDRIPLPLDPTPAGIPALVAVSGQAPESQQERIPDLPSLARLLYFSAGITKRITYPDRGEMLFRAAACTGALYHIELYLICGDLPGLQAGVYHFDPLEMALRPLRKGDYRRVLVEASGNEPGMLHAPAVLVYTDVFWRNACKYQAREYRHSFWDSGTILSHTLAMTAAHALPARLVTGFVDREVNHLFALDTRREAALFMLSVGSDPGNEPKEAPEVEELDLKTQPISASEKNFPAIYYMHQASSLADAGQVAAWRDPGQQAEEPAQHNPPSEAGADWIALKPFSAENMSPAPLEKVILRRGSSRRFKRESITFQELSTILHASTRRIPADFLAASPAGLNQAYLIVNAVDGLPSGTYAYHLEAGALELLRAGQFRRQAGDLALGQELAADASANIYFLADLHTVLERFGNRGYRIAQLEASITAGKMYLAAYALRRGATGLTFYDDTVTDFFSPHAAGKSVMFLIALGVPARRR